jgi:leucyl aminopeptidase
VLISGFGDPADLSEERVRTWGGATLVRLSGERISRIQIDLDAFGADGKRYLRAWLEGLLLAGYHFSSHRTIGLNRPVLEKVRVLSRDKDLVHEWKVILQELKDEAECVHLARDLSNEPSNIATPEFLAGQAQRLARENGLKCKVLTEADCRREKMNLFLAVGAGSEREGRVVVLEYRPKGVKNPKTLAWVGKGITFDSGGISIKPALRMEEMKHDMSGAASMLAALVLAARRKVKCRIMVVLGFTENMPSGSALQPGNVIRSRAGLTVEIINTDAEGRLILADLMDYAQQFKPELMLDMATLTGAVSTALGKQCAALLGNHQESIDRIRRASDHVGERVWQLPLWDEYLDDLRTEHADIKNSCNDALGGTIRAAIFLKQFVRKGTHWVHLDIAATGYNISHLSYVPKRGASGLFVRTLAQHAQEFV